jgi:hypothetical protein
METLSVPGTQTDLVLDAIAGIKDPLRPDVKEAVVACQRAGITVRMVTGDNLETAKAIARECGILYGDGVAMEGPDFRKMTPAALDKVLPKLQVRRGGRVCASAWVACVRARAVVGGLSASGVHGLVNCVLGVEQNAEEMRKCGGSHRLRLCRCSRAPPPTTSSSS